MPLERNEGWVKAQANSTYWKGALDDAEGEAIKWHSPDEPRSSQIFCISAFGGLRRLPEWQQALSTLFAENLPHLPCKGAWTQPIFEHSDRNMLGETGPVTPTSIDVFYSSPGAKVCVESKFLFDAREGFGGCSQPKSKGIQSTPSCAGYYGRGSDLKTRGTTNCRLEIRDGTRGARRYWELGRKYFVDHVYREQSPGEVCPLSGSSFQLMRNFLFAAQAAGESRSFGVLAIAPEKINKVLAEQIAQFKSGILRPEYKHHVALATYEQLIAILYASAADEAKRLGGFLESRINTLIEEQ
jgi:hypothetical protein